MVTRRKKPLSPNEVGMKYGFRSGLEEKVAEFLTSKGVKFTFETLKVPYVKPETKHIYTPDFILDNGIIIETKGRWLLDDRKKHILIRKQHPNLDIRILFQNANAKISKGSKTSYADFCEKHGIPYAHREIPVAWLKEKA
jgi:hypothetical protein